MAKSKDLAAERFADLQRQGFMKPKRPAKPPKSKPPIVACERCQDWHPKGRHRKPKKNSSKRNPSTKATILWAVGAGFVGTLLGYGICGAALGVPTQPGKQWSWWIEERFTDFGSYIPVIQSADGQRFELDDEVTRSAAAWAAEEAIKDRGGIPVEGKPVS